MKIPKKNRTKERNAEDEVVNNLCSESPDFRYCIELLQSAYLEKKGEMEQGSEAEFLLNFGNLFNREMIELLTEYEARTPKVKDTLKDTTPQYRVEQMLKLLERFARRCKSYCEKDISEREGYATDDFLNTTVKRTRMFKQGIKNNYNTRFPNDPIGIPSKNTKSGSNAVIDAFVGELIGKIVGSFILIGVCMYYFFTCDSSNDYRYEDTLEHPRYDKTEDRSTSTANYSWIVGTWSCTTPHGAITLVFNGDGQWGTCSELMYGSYKIGTYSVDGNTLRYKLDGESWSNTVEIRGNRLYLGDGYYLNKK